MSKKLRISKHLPVHIVEQHNDVVPFLHRAIASRLLPYSGITMVHFDSHPDLLIPISIQADTVFQPQLLYESISIENWLMPLAYAKHIDHIIWIKPPWAHQIETSEKCFTIGKCAVSGKMRLSSKENYFLTEGLFCPAAGLTDTSNLRLTVVELVPDKWPELQSKEASPNIQAARNNPECSDEHVNNATINQNLATHWKDIVNNKPYILDIDLDFFSTANPFKNMLKSDEEHALRRLYHYPTVTDFSDESILAFTQTREKQIKQLEGIFSDLETRWFVERTSYLETELHNFSLADFSGKNEFSFLDSEKQTDLTFLCRSVLLHRHEREVTFIVLHNFGCTLDDTELPHHISTPAQVSALETSFTNVLEHLHKPTIVTIARSSDDGYCPKEAVDQYQSDILKILEKSHGSLQISKSYE